MGLQVPPEPLLYIPPPSSALFPLMVQLVRLGLLMPPPRAIVVHPAAAVIPSAISTYGAVGQAGAADALPAIVVHPAAAILSAISTYGAVCQGGAASATIAIVPHPAAVNSAISADDAVF